jgi:hypothetical protein
MPGRDKQTLPDVIWFQYAKLVARSAFKLPDGHEAKKHCYGFIKNLFRELQTDPKSWSTITRADKQLADSQKACAYCGSLKDLALQHLVPESILVGTNCPSCEKVQSVHNQVWACKSCSSAKGAMGLYAFFNRRMPEVRKFYDFLPTPVEKKYLKTAYDCLACADCLDAGDLDGDGELTVFDVDHALKIHGRLAAPAPVPQGIR